MCFSLQFALNYFKKLPINIDLYQSCIIRKVLVIFVINFVKIVTFWARNRALIRQETMKGSTQHFNNNSVLDQTTINDLSQ